MTERRGLLLVVAVVAVLVIAGFGGGFTLARMSDTETKEVSVSAGTWTTTPERTPEPPKHAISFAAFCAADGTDASADAVEITSVVRGDEGEPFGITYESAVELSTVVLKGAQDIENLPGGTGDTVYFGNGADGADDQTPPEPCPSGETLVVKFEYDDGSSEFVPEIEEESSDSTGGVEAQSLETTASETVDANDSNVTTTATTTETTAGTPATETPTATPMSTATQTPTLTATSTETATLTETSAAETSDATSTAVDNETTGADADE